MTGQSLTPRITAEGFDPETGGFAYIMVDARRVDKRTLSAALDLLEALKALASQAREFGCILLDGRADGNAWDQALSDADAAIAKAEAG